jgi:hypothetical protein
VQVDEEHIGGIGELHLLHHRVGKCYFHFATNMLVWVPT